MWRDAAGLEFNPGNYYYVGGNSKFYGAVMLRYRERDFEDLVHADGVSPAWPIGYQDLEPWYCAAERMFQVRGALGQDPTEPAHSSQRIPIRPYPTNRDRRRPGAPAQGGPASVLASARHRYRAVAWPRQTPWDAYPDTRTGKFDAETAALALALEQPSVSW